MDLASPQTDSPLGDLARMLWQHRRLLERLHYQLTVQRLILSSGEDALLHHAVDDVQHSMDAITELEQSRAELTAEIGRSMGLDGEPSLQDLINRAPEPFEQILTEHRNAFLAIVAEITTESLSGREQLGRGLNLTRELTAFVVGDAGDGGYDARGTAVPGSAERRLLDQSL